MNEVGTRALAFTAIVGSWLFTVTWLVAPLWQEHYRPLDRPVSDMGALTAHLPGILNGACLVWALAIAACAVMLRRAMPPSRWRTTAVAGLALAAAGMAVIAFARLDCSDVSSRACFDAWRAGRLSWHHEAHLWASSACQLGLALSSLAVAGALRARRPLLALAPLAGGLWGLLVVVSPFFSEPRFEPQAHYGLYQRVGLLVSAGWIELLAAAVLMQLDRRRAASPSASAAPPRWSAGRRTRPSA